MDETCHDAKALISLLLKIPSEHKTVFSEA